MDDGTSVNSSLPRIFALAGPYISTVSGIIAAWATTHLHVLATFHIDQDATSGVIAQVILFALGYLGAHLAQSNWIKGHQIELAAARSQFIEAGDVVRGGSVE